MGDGDQSLTDEGGKGNAANKDGANGSNGGTVGLGKFKDPN